jgi:hypothetical protein
MHLNNVQISCMALSLKNPWRDLKTTRGLDFVLDLSQKTEKQLEAWIFKFLCSFH